MHMSQLCLDELLRSSFHPRRMKKATQHASMAPAIFRPCRCALGDMFRLICVTQRLFLLPGRCFTWNGTSCK